MASDTTVTAWGSGEDGQLGSGNNEEKEWVCSIKSLNSKNVRSVVAGSRNSLAICQDGKLFTWGWNQRGTLGHPPDTKTENIPSQVKALSNVKIVQAAIGGWHCLAVDDQGRAYAWGGNEYGQCGEEPERKDDSSKPLRRDIMIPQRCAPKLSVRQHSEQKLGKNISFLCGLTSKLEKDYGAVARYKGRLTGFQESKWVDVELFILGEEHRKVGIFAIGFLFPAQDYYFMKLFKQLKLPRFEGSH